MEKTQHLLYNLFLLLFIPVFTFISYLLLGNMSSLMGVYIIFFIVLLYLTYYTANKFTWLISKYYYCIVGFIACIFFVSTCYVCLHNPWKIIPGDLEAIFTGIKEVITDGKLSLSNLYFTAHRHQIFTLMFYSLANKIFVLFGATGPVSVFFSTILNCLMLTVAGCLIAFSVLVLTNKTFSLLSLIIFILFNSYWGCGIYIYSHTVSIFFVCLTIFCISCYSKSNGKQKYIFMLLTGITLAIARQAEGIILIALVATLIYVFLSSKSLKDFSVDTSLLVIAFLVTTLSLNALFTNIGIIDFSNGDNEKIPLTHWIMMGLKDNGFYNEDDFQATMSLKTMDEKKEFHKQEIINRIKSQTLSQHAKRIMSKEWTVWCGGVYGYNVQIVNPGVYNIAYRTFLILTILLSAISLLIKKSRIKDIPFLAFSQIYMLGVFIFVIIWETSPTYLFSSIPFIIVCFILSIHHLERRYYGKNI